MKIPKLSRSEMVSLMDLRRAYPVEFYSNKTSYFNSEHERYVREGRVWRTSIMGETRGGKSEVGSTIGFRHVNFFRKAMEDGCFRNLEFFKNVKIKLQEIDFKIEHICDNQQVYKDKIKEKYAKGELVWNQIWQIDEEKKSLGGLGSMSDLLESDNLNNIIAKFCQCEIWVQPLRFETNNCPFGLKVVKKDIINRVNWCLLFKIEQEPNGATSFKFLGWVDVPLHHHKKFRKDYNELKDKWIEKEIEGRVDERENTRFSTSEFLIKKYPQYFELKENGRFKYSRGEQTSILGLAIMNGEVKTVFNEGERVNIVDMCRLMVEEREGISR